MSAGGQYTDTLSRANTHLIQPTASGDKYKLATCKLGITVR